MVQKSQGSLDFQTEPPARPLAVGESCQERTSMKNGMVLLHCGEGNRGPETVMSLLNGADPRGAPSHLPATEGDTQEMAHALL